MTDDARNLEDSAVDRHGRAVESAKESAELAQDSVPLRAPERRRWFQYSLRTMFLGTALIACGLGLFLHKVDRARRAVAAIEAIGGTCEYRDRDTEPGQIEAWLRCYLPRDYFDDVILVLASQNAKITDAVVAHLSALPSLESLYLDRTQVSNAGLEHLASLTSLEKLALGGTQVTDAGLAHLSGLTSLEYLQFSGTQVTDAGLAHLSALTSLRSLDLSRTQVTDAGLAHLSGLTSLKYLQLGGTQVTDAGLKHLASLTSLEWLELGGTQVTDVGLEHLSTLPLLKELKLEGTQVTDAAVTALRKRLPTLSVSTQQPRLEWSRFSSENSLIRNRPNVSGFGDRLGEPASIPLKRSPSFDRN